MRKTKQRTEGYIYGTHRMKNTLRSIQEKQHISLMQVTMLPRFWKRPSISINRQKVLSSTCLMHHICQCMCINSKHKSSYHQCIYLHHKQISNSLQMAKYSLKSYYYIELLELSLRDLRKVVLQQAVFSIQLVILHLKF